MKSEFKSTNPSVTTSHPAGPYTDGSQAPSESQSEKGTPLPQPIAGYELLATIGKGGMGIVYKARQIQLNRVVALKMILAGRHASADEEARFFQEAELIARLKHPNVVQVYEFGKSPQDGTPYFSLEFLEGGSLAGKLKGEPQPAIPTAQMVATLARGMQAAHEQGIIHRDLKPANVLLTTEGIPRITDFGLAKQLDSEDDRTRTGAVMGTPSYMAPEQAEGKTKEIGLAADIYALGAILYEMLTGRPPFKGASAWDTVKMVIETEPVVVPLPPPGGAGSRQAAWEQFRSGVEEAFQRERWLQQGEHLSEDVLDILHRIFGQIQQRWQDQAAPRQGVSVVPLLWHAEDVLPLMTTTVEEGWMTQAPEILQGLPEVSTAPQNKRVRIGEK